MLALEIGLAKMAAGQSFIHMWKKRHAGTAPSTSLLAQASAAAREE
jgi:hypothetical protein